MTRKTGRMSGKTASDVKRRAKFENPGWRVIKTKKIHTVYSVTLERIEKPRQRKK